MTDFFPVQSSILAGAALVERVLPNYPLDPPLHCALLHHGDNDTYLVRTKHDPYILRVWHADERPIAQVEAEMALLAELSSRQVAVARPVQRRDGAYLQAVQAPEGTRFVGLFEYAPGEPPDQRISAEHGYVAGNALAQLHAAADSVATDYQRPQLDLLRLLDRPLQTLLPLLEHRPQDARYLAELVAQLRQQLAPLPTTPPIYGLCHGDLHKTNMLFDDDQTLTMIDFDCCGYGWRAYDLAILFWSTRHLSQARAVRSAFLSGYQAVRTLDDQEISSIPYFVAAQHICITAVEVEQAQRGVSDSQAITDTYLDGRIHFLKTWMQAVANGSYLRL